MFVIQHLSDQGRGGPRDPIFVGVANWHKLALLRNIKMFLPPCLNRNDF